MSVAAGTSVYAKGRAPCMGNGYAWSSKELNYLNDDTDVQLFGFLVRDVDPDERDLSGLVETLCDRRPKLMKIELLALYLPAGRIDGLATRVASKRAGDSP